LAIQQKQNKLFDFGFDFSSNIQLLPILVFSFGERETDFSSDLSFRNTEIVCLRPFSTALIHLGKILPLALKLQSLDLRKSAFQDIATLLRMRQTYQLSMHLQLLSAIRIN
jgi:hypothetical protein